MKNKVAVVTGSTQGLGESIARKLVSEGLSGLVICGRNRANGERLSAEFNKSGCDTIYVECDLAKIEDCERLLNVTKKKFNKVDMLVNSAAITDRGTLLETTPELYDHIFAINTRAPFFLMQGIAKVMIDNETPGTILNIISMSSYGGQPFLAAYSASKGALLTLTKNTAFALMRNNIRVNGLNLGWTDTPGEHAIQKKYHNVDENWLEKVEKEQPFGRLIKADEAAEVAAFLLSNTSGLMTGSIIDFDQSVDGANYLPPRP